MIVVDSSNASYALLIISIITILSVYSEGYINQSFKKRLQTPECLLHWKYPNSSNKNDIYNPPYCPSPKPYYFHDSLNNYGQHFPHFAQDYFNYISEMLSPTENNCVTFSLIKREARLSEQLMKSKNVHHELRWIKEMIHSMEVATNHSTLQLQLNENAPSIDGHPSLRFHHPVDAQILTAIILGSSPCPQSASRDKGNSSRLTLLILQREKTRQILNAEALSKAVFKSFADVFDASVRSLENGHSLHEQASVFNNASIVFSMHGAALTNVAFMKPCSVLIEVFPFAFYTDYFENLAKSVDLIYMSLKLQKHSSVLPEDKYAYCMHQLLLVKEKYNMSDFNVATGCTKYEKECRRCFRGVTGSTINIVVFKETLKKAIDLHIACKLQHIFYQ